MGCAGVFCEREARFPGDSDEEDDHPKKGPGVGSWWGRGKFPFVLHKLPGAHDLGDRYYWGASSSLLGDPVNGCRPTRLEGPKPLHAATSTTLR